MKFQDHKEERLLSRFMLYGLPDYSDGFHSSLMPEPFSSSSDCFFEGKLAAMPFLGSPFNSSLVCVHSI